MIAKNIELQLPNLQPNIRDLQPDVIDLLKEISGLMTRAKSDLGNNNYGDFCQEVNEAISNVKNLELRMAIVAPMKAGKSTIINAIVGQDLLPSRNAAMTTIPTKIFFNAEREKPVLFLNEQIYSVFADTWDSLQKQINICETKVILAKIAQYPHLINLAKEIKNNRFYIPQEITGRGNISLILTKLNDIVRLCSTIDPITEPLSRLVDVPCIETPFWHNKTTKDSQYLGNLVIVDTPGPNEAGENLKLTSVVRQELKKSSIVLIVLDFTQLNNQAAEAVKRQVQPVIDLIGQENLYVLVNKVDQRRQGDMSPEQVRDFVCADLNLSDSSDRDRIFEISARQAFFATKFLLELQQNPRINIPAMKTAEALAQEVLGIDWEEELEDITVEILQKKANRLLKKSGFTPFLEEAINALMESAAPKCMLSALNRCYGLLCSLKDDLTLRTNAISQDAEKLEKEIAALSTDLQHLEICRTRLKSVDKIKNDLKSKLDKIINQVKKEAKISIESYFEEKDYEQASLAQKVDIKAREALFTNLGGGNLLPKFITDKLKDSLGYKAKNIVEFSKQNEADSFAEQAVSWARKRAENCLHIARNHTEKTIEKSQQELVNSLELETKDILKKARDRLNKAFDIELSLPPNPQINNQLGSIDFQVNSATREVRDYKTEQYKPWYFLWIIEREKKVPIMRTESYYTVSLEEIVKEINTSIETSVNKISQGIDRYLDEDFKLCIDSYFADLNTYLSSYRNSVRQAEADQKLDLRKKEQLVANLSYLLPEAEEKSTKTVNYIKRIQQYI